MSKPSLKAALLTTTVAVAILAPAGAASAASVTLDDAKGDTWEEIQTGEAPTYVKQGSRANVDVNKTVVNHLSRKLHFTVKYHTLKSSGTRFGLVQRMNFDEGDSMFLGLETFGSWKGDLQLFTGENNDEVDCEGAEHDIDYAADRIEITIPRSCLGAPKWVKVGGYSFGSVPDGDDFLYVYDNTLKSGHSMYGSSDRITRA